MATETSTRTFLAATSMIVALLVVVAVVLALRAPTQLDVATPQGTVQRYVQGVLDGDTDDAFDQLTNELADGCEPSELRHAAPDDARVVIVNADVGTDTARVDVRITETNGEGPFTGGGYTFEETFILEHQTDLWLIAEAPWPFYHCPEVRP